MARSLSAFRCLEITLLVVIITVVWILMFLPVLIYFLVCIKLKPYVTPEYYTVLLCY